ncbi:MAG: methylase involved in ubiquinone/menaquinone biosynthesis [Chthonomonadaceae bacterium]|nr:methylase involved in ubiquinone/menaquinone biosynthesis [Chthonomonadaceae bacterium]
MNRPQSQDQIRRCYDSVASQYALHLFNELEGKPIDRELLDDFADRLRGKGTVCDVGCGPGQIASYLYWRGLTDVCGMDLSPAMVETARSLNPEMRFLQGDLLALDVPDASWAGIAAFYAFVNLTRPQLPKVFAEMRRVLQPGGLLLTGFHRGKEIKHVEEMWGVEMSLDFLFFETDEIVSMLRKAHFTIERTVERDPYPTVEYPSQRTYIFARA